MVGIDTIINPSANQYYKTSHSIICDIDVKAPRLQVDSIQATESRYDQTSAVATIVGMLKALETIPCTGWVQIKVIEATVYTDGSVSVLKGYENLTTRILNEIESRIKTFAVSYPESLFSIKYNQEFQPDDEPDYKMI